MHRVGRPSEQSLVNSACSKCAGLIADHDDALCDRIKKIPQSGGAGRVLAERIEDRGFIKTLGRDVGVQTKWSLLFGLNPFAANDSRYDGGSPVVRLSIEIARDLLRFDHLDLDRRSGLQMWSILGREGISLFYG